MPSLLRFFQIVRPCSPLSHRVVEVISSLLLFLKFKGMEFLLFFITYIQRLLKTMGLSHFPVIACTPTKSFIPDISIGQEELLSSLWRTGKSNTAN
ncbi:hypothetical protein P8452_03072 [Trifolium repens]|nr:hypothetical protein P8452_03072 [Trifolium repens]